MLSRHTLSRQDHPEILTGDLVRDSRYGQYFQAQVSVLNPELIDLKPTRRRPYRRDGTQLPVHHITL